MTAMKQTVRIIGGLYRGKKLPFPAIDGLRPTPDRIRETLFNWLMQDIRDAHCLDAFAGSGALGLEAFSRGAAHVTFLEKNSEAYAHLLKVLKTFDSLKLRIKKEDACDFFTQSKDSFNIIFLDPPFASHLLPRCLDSLFHSHVLIKGGLIYVESPHAIEVDSTKWQQVKLKKAGQVFYGLYKKIASA